MANTFIAYYRVSTKQQGDSGLGLASQKATAEAYIRQQQGELLAEYQDIASGKFDNRSAVLQALEHCKVTGSILVIAKIDRLARNSHFLNTLDKAGVQFVCCDMPTANNLILKIMIAVAEEEADLISRRTKEALAEAKKRGVKLGNPRLAEFRKPNSKLATQARTTKKEVHYQSVFNTLAKNNINPLAYKLDQLLQTMIALKIKTSKNLPCNRSFTYRFIKYIENNALTPTNYTPS